MKAPTSLLILPPELLINPLPPSFLHIPPYPYTSLPLHFFTLTLLYPYPVNSFKCVNSFKRLISCVHLLRSTLCIHLVRLSRLLCVTSNLVRPSHASVRLVSSCSSLLILPPEQFKHSIHSIHSKRSTLITT